jgi:hypothetical protein
VRDRDRPREVGDEHEGAPEDGDEHELGARIVAGDLRSELLDSRRQLVSREVDLADPRVGDYVRWLSPYFCARRSKSRR